jgi:hypothetical protein
LNIRGNGRCTVEVKARVEHLRTFCRRSTIERPWCQADRRTELGKNLTHHFPVMQLDPNHLFRL